MRRKLVKKFISNLRFTNKVLVHFYGLDIIIEVNFVVIGKKSSMVFSVRQNGHGEHFAVFHSHFVIRSQFFQRLLPREIGADFDFELEFAE